MSRVSSFPLPRAAIVPSVKTLEVNDNDKPDLPPKYPPITNGEHRVWWLNTNYSAKLAYENALSQRAHGAR